MAISLLDQTKYLAYNTEHIEQRKITVHSPIPILFKENHTIWLRSYTLEDRENIRAFIESNNLDDFLNELISKQADTNKVIELEDTLFISLQILSPIEKTFQTIPLIFILSPNFLWTIQNNETEYFDWIEQRLLIPTSLVRSKQADYLFGLMIKTIIASYDEVVSRYSKNAIYQKEVIHLRPTPEFMQEIESFKQDLFIVKKSTLSLRDSIAKIENTESFELEDKYFKELKEQVKNILNDIDFQIQTLESKISLLFSIQGHRMNEIMKTLTVFSVIFIPLTFIAGIYGMNFSNMPELEWENGYYYSLLLMLVIVLLLVLYIRRRFK